jgi:hypothetical protein
MKEVTFLGTRAQWNNKVSRTLPESHSCLSAFAPRQYAVDFAIRMVGWQELNLRICMNTENNAQSTIDNEIPASKFVEMLQCDGAREYMVDYDSDTRLEYLNQEIAKRIGAKAPDIPEHKVPNHFIIQQAAERYFSLVAQETRSLHFSRQELTIILNTTCCPVWQWYPYVSVAGMVADDNGVESLEELEPDSILRQLIEKLAHFSPTQNVALVDVCERIWRSQSGLPFDELCAELGMPLTQ